MLPRIVLYLTLGFLIGTMGAHWDTWQFWCILGLFWAVEQNTRLELLDQLKHELEQLRRRYPNND